MTVICGGRKGKMMVKIGVMNANEKSEE